MSTGVADRVVLGMGKVVCPACPGLPPELSLRSGSLSSRMSVEDDAAAARACRIR